MYGLLTSPSSFKGLSEDLMGGNIMLYYTPATSAVFYRGGFVVIKTSSTRYDWNDLKRITSTTTYYWPTALGAYNLTRQVYTLVQAIEMGNSNPELHWLLNEKMDDLKDSLKVYVSESTTETPIKRFIPVYIEPSNQPSGMRSTGSSSSPSAGTGTSVRDTATSRTPTKIELEALTLDNNEGRLKVDNVLVVVDNISSNSVSYHVKVTVEAEDNVVSDVEVNLTDDTTGESDSGSLGLIKDGSSKSWTSREFTASVTGDGITLHGSVSITYTPSCGPAPTATRGETVPATCNVPHTITESYSKTVRINTSIDPSKVHFTIRPSRTQVTAGKSVDFNITITNDNNNEISGYYSVKISIPQPNGDYEWASYNGHVSVPAHNTKTLHVTTINYGSPGTSEYHGTFDFGVSSASDSGEVIVSSSGGGTDQPSGGLEIEGVQLNPNSNIKAGDTVSFNVLVNNSYSSSKQVELKLFIDGKEVDSASGSVGAGSEGSFMLHWLAQAGEHSYTVKLYSLLGGQKSEEDERGGKVMVASSNQQFAVSLEAFPTELEGGGTVYFTIKGWNYAHDALNVQFHVVNESDKVVYPKNGGWISKYLPRGASNYTLDGFSWGVYGVGDHTYTLVARISGEEEKDTATIIVKPVNGTELQQAGFKCSDQRGMMYPKFFSRAYNQKRPATLFNLLSNFSRWLA